MPFQESQVDSAAPTELHPFGVDDFPKGSIFSGETAVNLPGVVPVLENEISDVTLEESGLVFFSIVFQDV